MINIPWKTVANVGILVTTSVVQNIVRSKEKKDMIEKVGQSIARELKKEMKKSCE